MRELWMQRLCLERLSFMTQRTKELSSTTRGYKRVENLEFGNTNIGVHGVEISGLERACGISWSGVHGADGKIYLTENLAPNKQVLQRLVDASILNLPILSRQKIHEAYRLLVGVGVEVQYSVSSDKNMRISGLILSPERCSTPFALRDNLLLLSYKFTK
jgi:hypothetical protein